MYVMNQIYGINIQRDLVVVRLTNNGEISLNPPPLPRILSKGARLDVSRTCLE
jgi:hypothetical protein